MYVYMDTISPVKNFSSQSSLLFMLTWTIEYFVPQLVLQTLGCLSSVFTDSFNIFWVLHVIQGIPLSPRYFFFLGCLWPCWSHSFWDMLIGLSFRLSAVPGSLDYLNIPYLPIFPLSLIQRQPPLRHSSLVLALFPHSFDRVLLHFLAYRITPCTEDALF